MKAKTNDMPIYKGFKKAHLLIAIVILNILCFITHGDLLAQNVGINTTGSLPDPSAGLDVNFSNKGFLMPRVSLLSVTDVTTIPTPTTSLLVYNTNPTIISGRGLGYYYWDGTQWAPFSSSTHYIGELYNGGVIFYIYKGADGIEHGLIASLTETLTAWQSSASLVNANRSWDGAYNTALMVNSPAAAWATSLGAGWYVPSWDEVHLLFVNRFLVNKTLFNNSATIIDDVFRVYWTSTEINLNSARYFYISDGTFPPRNKSEVNATRAVKAF